MGYKYYVRWDCWTAAPLRRPPAGWKLWKYDTRTGIALELVTFHFLPTSFPNAPLPTLLSLGETDEQLVPLHEWHVTRDIQLQGKTFFFQDEATAYYPTDKPTFSGAFTTEIPESLANIVLTLAEL